jgi:hypothetical protein
MGRNLFYGVDGNGENAKFQREVTASFAGGNATECRFTRLAQTDKRQGDDLDLFSTEPGNTFLYSAAPCQFLDLSFRLSWQPGMGRLLMWLWPEPPGRPERTLEGDSSTKCRRGRFVENFS